jgi:hypothetical protein
MSALIDRARGILELSGLSHALQVNVRGNPFIGPLESGVTVHGSGPGRSPAAMLSLPTGTVTQEYQDCAALAVRILRWA